MADPADDSDDPTPPPAAAPKPRARKPRAKAATEESQPAKTTRARKPAESAAPKRGAKGKAPAKASARKPRAKPGTIESAVKAVRTSKPAKLARSTAKQAADQLPTSRTGVAALVGAAALGLAGALAATVGRDATKRAAGKVRDRVRDLRDDDAETPAKSGN